MTESNRELLLLRHGRAEPAAGSPDRNRRLTDPGKLDIQRIGAHLQARGWLPDAVVASPAERALVTARETLKAGGMDTAALTDDDRIYNAEPAALLEVLADYEAGPRRLLLVGHNPGIESLLLFLSAEAVHVSAGTLARLQMPTRWDDLDAGCASLLDVVDPARLAKKFP